MKKINVKKNEGGQRLDKLLFKVLKNANASFIYKMLRKKNITLNGKKCDGKEIVNENDEITFFLSDETFDKFASDGKAFSESAGDDANKNADDAFIKPLLPKDIVYEDDNVLIVNKSTGELSQKAQASDVSVNERIVKYLYEKGIGRGEAFKPSVCNRLDRNTSGLIVAGKSLKGTQEFSRILKSHELKKFYLCMVRGNFSRKIRDVAYLSKDEKSNLVNITKNMTSGYDKIETEYIPLLTRDDYSLIAVRLITGKSHQIRAHLAYLGYPVTGDTKYGGKHRENEPSHQLLHAFLLVFPQECSLTELKGKAVACMPPDAFLNFSKRIFNEEATKNAIMGFQRTQGLKP